MHDANNAPEWSGKFFQMEEEDFGLMAVHVGDTRTHQPPEGWTLIRSDVDDDSEVFQYRRSA